MPVGGLGVDGTGMRTRLTLSAKLFFASLFLVCFLLVPYAGFFQHPPVGPVPRKLIVDCDRDQCEKSTDSSKVRNTWHDATRLPRELYEAVQADSSLLKHKAVASAFLPTPWLLPSGTALKNVLRYQGLHNDLDSLLQVRAMDLGRMEFLGDDAPTAPAEQDSKGAISVVYFGKSHTLLMQNWVYTAVRWAGITNYIVATWEEESLAACMAMNLPCFNASAYPPLPIAEGEDAKFKSTSFVSITWVKPLLTRDILGRGYHVHSSDVDIAFPPKAFWPSMLRFLVPAGADVAMERDHWGPVNTGCVVLRPTEFAKAWMAKRVAKASEQAQAGLTEQGSAMQLKEDAFRTCQGPWDCKKMAKAREGDIKGQEAKGGEAPQWALIRRYHSAWDAMYQDHCAGAHLDWLTPIDPCQPGHTNYHVVCVTGSAGKTQGFKGAGLWFLDESSTSGCLSDPLEGLPRSSPLQAAAAVQQLLGAAAAPTPLQGTVALEGAATGGSSSRALLAAEAEHLPAELLGGGVFLSEGGSSPERRLAAAAGKGDGGREEEGGTSPAAAPSTGGSPAKRRSLPAVTGASWHG